MHGRKIDQISAPLAIDHSFLPSARRIVDYRCGGSFGLVLDGRSKLFHVFGFDCGVGRSEK